MTLEQFTKELKSDEMWVEAMRNPSRFKSLDAAIEKVWGQCISDGTLKQKPIGEHRKHVFNVLGTQKYGEVSKGVQLQQDNPFKGMRTEEKELESVDYETHQKRLQDWLDTIAKNPVVKTIPRLTSQQIKEEGDWEPKKQRSHHHDDNDIWRHKYKIEYSRLFSDPLSHTGRLKPGAPDFEEWMQTTDFTPTITI